MQIAEVLLHSEQPLYSHLKHLFSFKRYPSKHSVHDELFPEDDEHDKQF